MWLNPQRVHICLWNWWRYDDQLKRDVKICHLKTDKLEWLRIEDNDNSHYISRLYKILLVALS